MMMRCRLKGGAGKDNLVIQRKRSDRRIPRLVCTGNDNGAEITLSFSRFARMTEEVPPLPRPR